MSSQNPGISAAGKALGKTARNPASGPAAIGGMVVPGAEFDQAAGHPSADASGQLSSDLAQLRARLARAVSDITRLAQAVEACAVDPPQRPSSAQRPSS